MTDYLLFTIAFLASAISPGADTLLVTTRALVSKASAVVTIAGIILGKAIMVAAIYLGLASLISSNQLLLDVIQWLGAGFLIWRGVALWIRKYPFKSDAGKSGDFLSAFVISISNPQPFGFYLAIVPTVIATTQLPILLSIVVIGFSLVGGFYMLLARSVEGWLKQPSRFKLINRLIAMVFFVLAVTIALR